LVVAAPAAAAAAAAAVAAVAAVVDLVLATPGLTQNARLAKNLSKKSAISSKTMSIQTLGLTREFLLLIHTELLS